MNGPTNNNAVNKEKNAEYGYLTINAVTALGGLPAAGALITVYDDNFDSGRHGVVYMTQTDRSGKTEAIRLPARPRLNSMTSGAGIPCMIYTVEAELEGFYPVVIAGSHIYSGVVTVQPVEFIPLMAGTLSPPFPIEIITVGDSRMPTI